MMNLIRPSQVQLAAIVQALYAVASAGGRAAPQPIETDSIAAIQRHLLGQDPPIAGAPGPLPEDLATILDTSELRRQTIRFMAVLPVIARRVSPDKVAVVEMAAARLGIEHRGLDVLRLAADGKYRRVTFALAKRFLDWTTPTGKARLRDWGEFIWWMLPRLHGPKTARKHQELTARYEALAALPEGSFGRTLYDFFATYEVRLPGEPRGLPWSMHEVYHVLSEYGVSLEAELLLTGFMGGTHEDGCLDQMLFGLLSYHAGKHIVGGVVAEGLLVPDDYFRAVARGAAVTVDLVHRWDLWEVVEVPLAELRARYNVPPITAPERAQIMGFNGLLTGPGHSTPAAA
jgi:hypothetical protein